VYFASLSQPFFQDQLILLFYFCEDYRHAVSAHIHDLTKSGEDRAAVNDAEPNFGACRQGFLSIQLAAEDTEIRGLFADFAFGLHLHHIDAGGKRISAGSRSLDQVPSPKFDDACMINSFMMNLRGAHGYLGKD
jgi:hypothetical protein